MSLQMLNIIVSIPFALFYPSIINILKAGEQEIIEISLEPNITLFGLALINFVILDAMFLPWYYKNPNKIMVPLNVSLFAFLIIFGITASVPVLIPEVYELLGGYNNLLPQFIFLIISIIIYLLGHFLIAKVSEKNFLKVDI
jgi:hypothetical protein